MTNGQEIKRKNGWTLIYVIAIFSVLALVICNLVGSFERKIFYIDNYKKNILKEDLIQKKKEYLMTEFNVYMKENINKIKEETIEAYFSNVKIENYLENLKRDNIKFKEGCNISYNIKLNLFEINLESHIYRFFPIIGVDDVITYKFVVLV